MDAQIHRKKKVKTSSFSDDEDYVVVLAPPPAAGASYYASNTTSTSTTAGAGAPHPSTSSNNNDHKEDLVVTKRPHDHDDDDHEYHRSGSRKRTAEGTSPPPRRDKNHHQHDEDAEDDDDDDANGEEEEQEHQDQQQHDDRHTTRKQKQQLPEEQQQQQKATSVTTEGAKEDEDCAPPPPPPPSFLSPPHHQPKRKHKELDQEEVDKHHHYQTSSPVVEECVVPRPSTRTADAVETTTGRRNTLDEEKPYNHHHQQEHEQDHDDHPRRRRHHDIGGRSARLPPPASGSACAANDTADTSRVRTRTDTAAGVLLVSHATGVENHHAATANSDHNKDEEEQEHLQQEQQPLMVMDTPEINNNGSYDSNKVTYPCPLRPATTKEKDDDSVIQKDDGLEKQASTGGGGVASKIRTATTTTTTTTGGTTGPTSDCEEDRSDQRNNLLSMPPLGTSEQSDVAMKEDEGETVPINVARAQQKMMRFFFGDAAADEIAKNEVVNNDQAKMKERKVTVKDASRRMYIRFPHKLMYTLECGDYSDILSWNFNGASFKIEDRYLFETKVLPEIFKDAKFSSFRRKLNRWYFKRHRSEKVFTVSHPYFRQGNYSLCDLMACGDSKQCELQELHLESIPPALLGHQAAYPPETSTLVARSAMHVAQPPTLGVEKYSNFPHGDAVSGFPPSHMMLPPSFDPATGLIVQHQRGTTSRNPLPNDNGSASMPYNITKSPPWMLHGAPNASNIALQSSYSGFYNMGVGDCSIPGISLLSENPLARNNGRHGLPTESAFQAIQAGNQVISGGYLPTHGLHPVNRVGDGSGASLLSANQPFPPNNSNYLGTPQMSNFETNFGIHAGFVDSQPRLLAAQTAVPQYVSLSAPMENNAGRYNVETLLSSTYPLNTLRMPPFAMTALSQQQQALHSEQNRLSEMEGNVPEHKRSAN